MSSLNDAYLQEAKNKFEEQFSKITVSINATNDSLIVQSNDNDINLIKTYQLKSWNNYQEWIDNFKFHLLAERNKKINVVDIFDENRSFNQRCASCGKPNPYGDLNCSQCYQDLEIYYNEQSQKYEKSKIKQ